MRPAELLFPRPAQLAERAESLVLPARPAIVAAASDPASAPAVGHLERRLAALGHPPRLVAPGDGPTGAAVIRLVVAPGDDPQAYRLAVSGTGVEIVAAGAAGLLHGAATLGQWLAIHAAAAPASAPLVAGGLTVDDRPSLARRGVMLDVSRDRVPTVETVERLVERLVAWKINELQLYTEHTFAYRGHERVWRDASPWTCDEVRRLDAFCAARGIELVPNQNSFGHLHRWLAHEPYRRLAECPKGLAHPFGDRVEPFSLCPGDPGSLALLADLYDQLLPCFGSRQVNVGLDETFDLGLGRSAAECQRRGKGAVYLDFLLAVHRLAAERGRRIQFWGDIILDHPELIAALPRDAVALAWGYEADHPFADQARRFAQAGLDFHVCPGTSSWNSLAGRVPNALVNLARAAREGAAAGAHGYLITDWGDNGHLQPLAVSYLPLLAGADFAWNAPADDAERPGLAAALDLHAFDQPGAGLGAVARDLGGVYRYSGVELKNGTVLFHLLLGGHRPLDHPRFSALGRQGLERVAARLGDIGDRLAGVRAASAEARRSAAELGWVADALALACRLGLARCAAGLAEPVTAVPSRQRRRLAADLDALAGRHRQLWLARHRPGGLDDSLARLLRVRDGLLAS